MQIRLSRNDARRALDFAEAVAEAKTRGAPRRVSFEDVRRDHFVGRLGEIALRAMLASKGIEVMLDESVYEPGEWDRCDIIHNGWWVDVKCTATMARHLRLECRKLAFRAEAGELPHVFVAVHLLDCDPEEAIANLPETLDLDLAGWIDVRELDEANPVVSRIAAGAFIPGTRNRVEAESVCVAYADLCRDWDRFAGMLEHERAFDRKAVRVPGETQPGIADGASEIERESTDASEAARASYSLLLAGEAADRSDPGELERAVARGVRVLLFTRKPQRFKALAEASRKRVTVYGIREFVRSFAIVDGKTGDVTNDDLKRLSDLAPFFNPEQFAIEHAPADRHIIVRASAGTGKTTVMIDRITYLFATDPTLRPADVGMVTFTNKATDNMLGKLQKRMTDMYELTGEARWLSILEELGELELGTIDAFFRRILADEGSAIGLGARASLASFRHEKREIVRRLLDEHYRARGGEFLNQYVLADYAHVDLAQAVLEKLHGLGYFDERVETADFGGYVADKDSRIVNEVVSELVRGTEARYRELKEESNAYDVEDIKAGALALARLDLRTLHRRKLRYLFVDEFQDTDTGQIQTIAWLQRAMGCFLFAVGDVKQSIYRFRGAEESAFKALTERLCDNGVTPESILECSLVKNYRTSPEVVGALNTLFGRWGEQNLLTWEGDAVPVRSEQGSFDVLRLKYPGRVYAENFLRETVSDLLDDARGADRSGTAVVCALGRTNADVRKFEALCRSAGMRCYGKTDGDFYRSAPVLDLATVLGSFLRPDDTRALWNVLMTPFVTHRPDPAVVAGLNGDEARVRTYLKGLLRKEGWVEFEREAKYDFFFPFLERLVERCNPAGRVASLAGTRAEDDDGEAVAYEAAFYRLNLNKILELLSERFSRDGATLLEACRFLELSIDTNRSEDTLYPEFDDRAGGVRLEAMTVHKAKGLEFDTVLIPYTSMPFFSDCERTEIAVAEADGRLRVGWKTRSWKTKEDEFGNRVPVVMRNTVFGELEKTEAEAVRRDEARLLYVALTRAERRLTVVLPPVSGGTASESWSTLME